MSEESSLGRNPSVLIPRGRGGWEVEHAWAGLPVSCWRDGFRWEPEGRAALQGWAGAGRPEEPAGDRGPWHFVISGLPSAEEARAERGRGLLMAHLRSAHSARPSCFALYFYFILRQISDVFSVLANVIQDVFPTDTRTCESLALMLSLHPTNLTMSSTTQSTFKCRSF